MGGEVSTGWPDMRASNLLRAAPGKVRPDQTQPCTLWAWPQGSTNLDPALDHCPRAHCLPIMERLCLCQTKKWAALSSGRWGAVKWMVERGLKAAPSWPALWGEEVRGGGYSTLWPALPASITPPGPGHPGYRPTATLLPSRLGAGGFQHGPRTNMF